MPHQGRESILTLQIDHGYSTAVTDRGAGPALVLVHGTPLDARAWEAVAPRLGQRCRVIAYDLRGHGSAAAEPLPASYETLAGDVARLLDSLEIERAHVAGHSFGGQVAQTFAAAFPKRLESLTVVCSRSGPFPPFAAAADQVEAGEIAAVGEAALARWFAPPSLERGEPGVLYARACIADAVPQSFATALRMISTYDSSALLPEIAAPTRWIAAERDPATDLSCSSRRGRSRPRRRPPASASSRSSPLRARPPTPPSRPARR